MYWEGRAGLVRRDRRREGSAWPTAEEVCECDPVSPADTSQDGRTALRSARGAGRGAKCPATARRIEMAALGA